MFRATFAVIAIVVLAARLCHISILWVEEAYGMAAAAEILRGRILYQDIWFDKPPLYAFVYTLIAARPGLGLRILGAIFVLLCCWAAYRLGRQMGGRALGLTAAALLAFFLTFAVPSAAIPLAPDLLMVLPHITAVWFAYRGKAFASGLIAGLGLLLNTKAAFVLAACLLWTWREWPRVLAGFAVGPLFAFALLPREWIEQVWVWGGVYARDTFIARPVLEAIKRTGNWAGFHAALVLAAFWTRDRRLWVWAGIALLGIFPGVRFFPRYYFILLPPLVMLAAAGCANMPRLARAGFLALLLVPLIRFGPRYVQLARGDRTWPDIAMNQDSQAAGEWIRTHARPGDELLVWGYRPDIFIYSGLPAGTRYLDSQPLTGVLADRHLSDSRPSLVPQPMPPLPTFIADGLGPYNPALRADRFADLGDYAIVHRTAGTIIYSRSGGASREMR
ncbi:MAG TPA: glycosyltransferase family 39 protein [Bryobacteraceae bacterium]|nr:glycosyltransferase family 39 protein [Bryobacteraceae bacterium]